MRSPAPPSPRRRGLVGLTAASLVAAPLAFGLATPASAVSPDVVISEVYGGGGNSGALFNRDFVELYNPTSVAVDLAGLSLQGRAATGSSSGALVTLTGSIPAGGTYVVATSAAGTNGAALPSAPPQSASWNLGAAGGQVLLVDGTAAFAGTGDLAGDPGLIDMIGWGATGSGTPASSFETAAGAVTANATAIVRTAADADNNAGEFEVAAPTPDVAPDFGDDPAVLNVTNPGPQSGTVGNPITPLELGATGGTAPYTVTATNLPDGLTFDADTDTISGTPTTAGPTTVELSVTDGADGTDSDTFVWTIAPAAGLVTIAEIQGSGDTTPLAGQTVKTRGVVTATYPTGDIDGFVIQTGGTGGATDATPGASDAIFVWGGSDGFATYPEIGDSLEVTGDAVEGGGPATGLTQLIVDVDSDVVELGTALPAVTALETGLPATNTAREAHESELVAPTGPFTVSDVYDGSPSASSGFNSYGEITLAAGDTPLIQPTEVEDAQTGDIAGVVADNDARRVLLDDGASINFVTNPGFNNELPWMSKTYAPRVGAEATFAAPVILEFRNGFWKFQPTSRVTDTGTDVVEFEDTRPANLNPQDVGGELKIATFNVLNYFNTTGQDWVAAGNTCSYFNDRAGNPIANQNCSNNGPRGAATDVSFDRQETKIVNAINRLDADVVSLEEIENSIALGEGDRDDALSALVDALNAAAGADRWEFVPSPAAADLPPLAEQDVIRNAFIYDPNTVALVGGSKVLVGDADFSNAREPLAQAFKAVGASDDEAFGVVVNHFKSKGTPSGNSACTGLGDNSDPVQGCYNGDRLRQAQSLAAFADDFAADNGIEAMFLTGDFNAYTEEDPIQALDAAGYTSLESDTEGEESYSFNGLAGSLDHVLANDAALAWVDGVDIWEVNANESVFYQYSRFNYTASDLFDVTVPFAASDHNPEIVGITPAADETGPIDLQLLNINDFHGRIDGNTTKFATTVEQLRAQQANTLFLSAGDNIGASLFASSLSQDQPTIDVLNALELRSSAVGNHEFDNGFADLTDRVIPASDFSILGANVYEKGTTTPALEEYDIFTVDGLDVAVIGVVTETTPTIVSPAGVAGLDFGNPVEAVNRVTAELTDGDPANGEADVIVAEYHEGAGAGIPDGSTLEAEVDQGGTFAEIVNETSADVDVIFTGHTHKRYAWDAPVPGEPGTTRPVLQTGSYGEFVGKVVLELDRATGEVISYTQDNVARAAAANLTLPRVAEVKAIVDKALADAALIGNQPVGEITDDITTAFSGGTYGPDGYTGGGRDDRAAESTLGALVANALYAGAEEFSEPDLAFTNSGGLRNELYYAGDTSTNPLNTDGVVTFAEANAVLTFNNTLAIVEMTGASIKKVLEQQWQTNAAGEVITARPYAQLGMSDNVQVTADESRPYGDRITSVRINGVLLDPTQTYTVSTLTFLATGGDNFRAFTEGDFVDTGLLDNQLWRDYLASNKPLSPDFARQQVFAKDLPASVTAGEPVVFQLGVQTGDTVAPITGTTLNLTSQGSPVNTEVVATLVDGEERREIGTYTVTDGIAPIDLLVPDSAPAGSVVELVAAPSGTTVVLPVEASDKTQSSISANAVPEQLKANTETGAIAVTVTGRRPSGLVTASIGDRVIGGAELVNGSAQIPVGPFAETGVKDVVVSYAGDARNVGSSTSTSLTVVANPAPAPDRADATVAVTIDPSKVVVLDDRATVSVTVSKASGVPTGAVLALVDGEIVGAGELFAGKADITLLPFTSVGTTSVEIRYYGDATTKPASTTASVDVVKAKPSMKVKAPKKVTKGKKATIVVTLEATGFEPTGTVTVKVNGKKVTKRVKNGEVTFKVRMTKLGKNKVKIRYSGDDLAEPVKRNIRIKVKRR